MINKDTIAKWWQLFVGDNELVEIRILGRFQYSGYFKSLDNLLRAIEPFADLDDEQLYFTINSINDACYGRQQCEKIIKSPKATTTDNDVVSRKFILLDFDPKRATGVNASDQEFELAHKKAQAVFKFLRDRGFQEPIICVSGNGWHIHIKVDLPNTNENNEIIKRFLQALGMLFTDDYVEIDEKVFNAGRICKLYGTTAKKGANIPDRPWRMSDIVYVPQELKVTPLEKIQEIADLMPVEQQVAHNNNYYGNNDKFDLDKFLNEHGVAYKKVSVSNGTKYLLDHCFFDENHKGKDAVLFQYNSGAINYVCLHQSCKNHGWRDVRLMFDPHAYDYENNQRKQNYGQRQYQPKPKYEIKKEMPELGEKWLSMSDIKKIDITQLESVKTGYTLLDKAIMGLNMSEVTLLSGSNSSGKSSWLNNVLLNIVEQNVKVALWSGELRADILKAWIQMVAAGKRHVAKSQYAEDKYYVPQMVGEKIDQWMDGKFFLYNNEYGAQWEQIFHDMQELLKGGVKVFALDNLFSLNIDLLEGDRNNKQKELILQIKDFAMKNKVHIILVAHPRKVMTFLRKNDISGTSDLTNAVDNVIIIHRTNNDFFHAGAEFFGQSEISKFQGYGNVIEVAKNRLFGVCDFMVGMYYEHESRRFMNEMYEEKAYGWEEIPQPQTFYETNYEIDEIIDFEERNDSPF